MIPRRNLVTGGVLGGLVGALTSDTEAAAAPAAGADVTDLQVKQIADAIAALRGEVQGLRSFSELGPVRSAQVIFLRTNGRLPAYIEVGTSVWYAVHDWHIRWQQPLTLGRDNLGRYTMLLDQTLLIMRTETDPGFVGVPYDNA